MKKSLLPIVACVLFLSGCVIKSNDKNVSPVNQQTSNKNDKVVVPVNQQASDKKDTSSVFLEIGAYSPAWGGQLFSLCHNGKIYVATTDKIQIMFVGQGTEDDMNQIKDLLGKTSITYKKTFDDPNAMDDEYENILTYRSQEPKQEISDKKFEDIESAVGKVVEKNYKLNTVYIEKNNSGDQPLFMEWVDSSVINFKKMFNGFESQRIKFEALNEKQLRVIKDLDQKYKKGDPFVYNSWYIIKEGAGFYQLWIYDKDFAITNYPNLYYFSIEEFANMLNVDKQKLINLGVNDEEGDDQITQLLDKTNVADLITKTGSAYAYWSEGGEKKISQYGLRLGLEPIYIDSDQVCK